MERFKAMIGKVATGAASDGLYQGGTVSSATELTSFTVSGSVTMVGMASRW